MHIHILGICGTFMGGIAAIAKAMASVNEKRTCIRLCSDIAPSRVGIIEFVNKNSTDMKRAWQNFATHMDHYIVSYSPF